MKTYFQAMPYDHACGYWQRGRESTELARLTLQEVYEIERRMSQGWRLYGDLQRLICDVKHYLARQSK
jgi:hypothetical protein